MMERAHPLPCQVLAKVHYVHDVIVSEHQTTWSATPYAHKTQGESMLLNFFADKLQ